MVNLFLPRLLSTVRAEPILVVGVAHVVAADLALVRAWRTPSAQLHAAYVAIVFRH